MSSNTSTTVETSTPIETREELHEYLQVALQLEHATIPPYLTALYSIHPGTNLDATTVIRVVAIEEMLHLTLAANILNAVGGTPNFTRKDFVPNYPTYLPSGQTDFKVGLEKFSESALETFLNIERPAARPETDKMHEAHELHHNLLFVNRARLLQSEENSTTCLLPTFKKTNEHGEEIHLHYHSIGEFYKAIEDGIERLVEKLGEKELFCGDIAKQVGPEYYYSGGGDVVVIHNWETAKAAIDLISEQGEGCEGEIYDSEGELSHYYRFQQLTLGRYYQKGDKSNQPTGGPVNVDWNQVYPCKTNSKVADFEASEELTQSAKNYNASYKKFLASIEEAFNGKPELLISAVGEMFHIKDLALNLIKNPIPGQPDLHAAPTFQMDEV